MNNIQRITVEVDGESPFEYVIAKQGEANSRIVEIELMEKSVAYNIPEGVKAMVKYRKPDGKKVLNDCTYSGNIVTVTYTEQMLAAYGTGKGEIMLVKGTEIIKSATFWTKVVKTVYKENGLISDDELVSLAGTLIEVNQTLEKIDSTVTGAETAVEEAEQALQQAEEMQQSCTAATENANQAAENCNTATADMQQKCNEAVESANVATTAAENATENANQVAENCNTATANMQQECNEALDMINIAISEAEEATGNANQITADCNTAIQNATAATEGANQAAEKCNDIIDGLTPRIGEDGNWYVGKEDTGVKANGGITVYDGFDSESTINAASARTVKDLKEDLESHTHTREEITDFPTTMKNPTALTVKFNGASQGAYDGSTAKEIDITPSGIGAAASSHTHSYAGSSSAGGVANSAKSIALVSNELKIVKPSWGKGEKHDLYIGYKWADGTSEALIGGYHFQNGNSENVPVYASGFHGGRVIQTSSNNENPTISQIMVTNGSDNYLRKASLSHLKSALGSMPPNSHTHSYLPLNGGTMTGSINLNNNASLNGNVLRAADGYNLYIGANKKHMTRFFAGNTSDVFAEFFEGTEKKTGVMRLYATNGKAHFVKENPNLAENYTLYFPTGAGTLALSSSDIRLKENVKDTNVNNALDIVNSIKFRQFDWKDSGKHQDIGFVVDELEEIDPHLKLDGTGGYVRDDLTDEEKQNVENMNVKCVDTFYLMGYYGKAIQELYSIIRKQQKEIINLKKLVEEKGGQM